MSGQLSHSASMLDSGSTWFSPAEPRPRRHHSDQGGTAISFLNLKALSYYAPGVSHLYIKNTWASTGALISIQLGQINRRLASLHADSGTFQIYSGDQQLAVEHTGYYATFPDGTSPEEALAHNGIVYNGVGELGNSWYQTGMPQVIRLESTDTYTYAAVDLTNAYSSQNSQMNNPYAGHTVREFIFIRPLQTLFIVDRLESSSAGVTMSFLLHTPRSPTIVDASPLKVSLCALVTSLQYFRGGNMLDLRSTLFLRFRFL